MVTVIGPGTPYITPDVLQREPLGIAWGSLIPRGGTPTDLSNVLADICQQSTGLADGYCNQVLRATLNTEQITGPNFRITVDNSTAVTRIGLTRTPVLQVTNVQVALDGVWPRSWTTVPSGYYEPEIPVLGVYGASSPSDSGEGGQSIRVAPGFINWARGRNGYRVKVTYINGWPHTSLTAQAAASASTISVDDCTGWAPTAVGEPGAVGIVVDGGLQEVVTVTAASVTSGPGTLTLSTPLSYTHNAGVLITTMPAQIRWACALFSAAQALTRGATTTTVHSTGGGTSEGSKAPEELSAEAELILHPFKRVW